MKYFLILLCLVSVYSYSSPNHDGTGQKPAEHKDAGSSDNPVFVKIIKPEKTDAETKQESADRKAFEDREKNKAASDQQIVYFTGDVADWTKKLVYVGLAQVLIFIAQLIFIWRQECSAERIERAYLFMNPSAPYVEIKIENGTGMMFYHLSNHGKTPAILLSVKGAIHEEYGDRIPDALPKDKLIGFDIPDGVAIPPGGEGIPLPYPFSISPPSPRMNDIQSGKLKFCIWGIVRYKDIFRIERETGFCWEITWKKKYVAGHDGTYSAAISKTNLNYQT
jgi:hypothetical protein